MQINSLLARVHSPQPNDFEWILLYSNGHDWTAMDNGFDMNIIIHILTDICECIINIEMIIGNKEACIECKMTIFQVMHYHKLIFYYLYRHVCCSVFPSMGYEPNYTLNFHITKYFGVHAATIYAIIVCLLGMLEPLSFKLFPKILNYKNNKKHIETVVQRYI